ncbi:hypothetical protein PIROE2DRAFT_25782, partial [Piromyces sp. E2]
SPKINLSEDEKNYYIHADLPGLNKEQVKMELSDNDHKNKNKKENKEEKKNNKKYSRIECSYGRFERSFSIPENADVNSIQAKLENGVLEVTLPKIESPKVESKHTIQIQ